MARKRSRYPGLYKPDNSPYWQYRFMVNGKRLSVSTGETAVEAAWQKAQTLRAEAKSAAKDRYAAHRKRPLSQHIGDWAESLRSDGRNARYVNQTVGRATRVLDGCKLRTWDDLFDGQASPASRVQRFLSKLRDQDADASGEYEVGELLDGEASVDPETLANYTPLREGEANEIKQLCGKAIPGPLVVDDVVDGEGVPVAGLPDGRNIISLGLPSGTHISPETLDANAQLICRARTLLLRLLAS